MTILTPTATRSHTDVITGHAYTIPVVREVPRPPVQLLADSGW
jgi:hypothetical protein